MTTSGTTAFSNTARDFVKQALLENAIIAFGDDPESDEMTACIFRLNAMLKTWGTRELGWKQDVYTASGTANTATITLPVYVREVNGARYLESATNERAMSRFERDDYAVLPNKAAKGTPSIYNVEQTSGALVLSVWPVPTANFSLKLDIDRALDTVTDPSETIDIPEEWTECVMTNLALRCCNIFGAEPTSELVQRAQLSERELFDAYRPASYFMGAM
jgi:hypothetical protein